MTIRSLATAVTILALAATLASAQIVPTQKGADTPQSAPSTTSKPSGGGAPATQSLDGAWRYEAPCTDGTLYYGSLRFSGDNGTFRGEVSDIDGKLLNVSLDGNRVSFILEYERLGTWSEQWTGTLAGNGNSMSGSIADSWSGDCSFTARRQ